jgi:hypothetical protein
LSVIEVGEEEQRNKALYITIIMIIIGLFSPLCLIGISGLDQSEYIVLFLLWSFITNENSFVGNIIFSDYAPIITAGVLLLRIFPAFQMYQYYQGKISRNRAYIANIVGDGLFLLAGLGVLLLSASFSGIFVVPFPIQLICGVLILWRLTGSEVTTPWKESSKPKSLQESSPVTLSPKDS